MDEEGSPDERLVRRQARLAGGTPGQLAAWLGGTEAVPAVLAERLARVRALPPTSVLLHQPLLSLAELALDLRQDADAREGAFGLRWVAQAISDGRRLDAPEERRVWFAEPDPIGDERWDAMLAGVAEREARRIGWTVPAWAGRPDRVLATWWWLAPVPGLRAYAFTHTPAELRFRGVFVSEESLESV